MTDQAVEMKYVPEPERCESEASHHVNVRLGPKNSNLDYPQLAICQTHLNALEGYLWRLSCAAILRMKWYNRPSTKVAKMMLDLGYVPSVLQAKKLTSEAVSHIREQLAPLSRDSKEMKLAKEKIYEQDFLPGGALRCKNLGVMRSLRRDFLLVAENTSHQDDVFILETDLQPVGKNGRIVDCEGEVPPIPDEFRFLLSSGQ